MEIDGQLEMFTDRKLIGLFLYGLNFAAQAFSNSVGDSVPKIGQNLLQVLVKHPCLLYHRLKPRMSGPEKPCFKMTYT